MDAYSSSRLDATPLDAIEPFTEELTEIVLEMQAALPSESKLLEGADILEREDIVIPPPEDPKAVLQALTGKNELSNAESYSSQWMPVLLSGSSRTDPTLISTLESNSSACIAELFVRTCPTLRSNAASSPMSICSFEETSGACGCATGVTNESCACMEQTISVPTVGMLSEEK